MVGRKASNVCHARDDVLTAAQACQALPDGPSHLCDVELLVPHSMESAKVRAEYARQALSLRACLMVGRAALMCAVFVRMFRQLHRPAQNLPDNLNLVSPSGRPGAAKYDSQAPSRAYLVVGRTASMRAVRNGASSAAQACQAFSPDNKAR